MKRTVRYLRCFLLASTCLGGGLSVIAQGPPPDTGRSAALITKYDINSDGKLSDAEIEAAQPLTNLKPHTTAAVALTATPAVALPSSGNTKFINDREMQDLFNRFDVNQNEKLDLDEMEALRKSRAEKNENK